MCESCSQVKMNRSLIVSLVLCSALIGQGWAIRCYSCKDYTASCTKQRDCSSDDACLSLTERGGMTHRQCLKYSDCEYSRLTTLFPQVSSFTYKCCNADLCNSAPSSKTSSLIGLMVATAAMWWCMH
ncbi:CD59 glycoprotein [Genypterus blacodes]|uniref:CD59 glycoprotein n=1 Tax=Genypterus blacodes TaxID=154954 RepID=UPI003F775FD6